MKRQEGMCIFPPPDFVRLTAEPEHVNTDAGRVVGRPLPPAGSPFSHEYASTRLRFSVPGPRVEDQQGSAARYSLFREAKFPVLRCAFPCKPDPNSQLLEPSKAKQQVEI